MRAEKISLLGESECLTIYAHGFKAAEFKDDEWSLLIAGRMVPLADVEKTIAGLRETLESMRAKAEQT